MSRIENQRRLFLELLEELRPHWRKDPGLPKHLTAWLADHRAGSRDRRLYRELAYTTWRILPWIEDATPETVVGRVARHAQRTDDTSAFIDQFASDSAEPPHSPNSLLPDWLESQNRDIFEPVQRDALLSRAPLWIRLQTTNHDAVAAEFTEHGIPFEPSKSVDGAWKIPAQTKITQTQAYQNGLYEVQDIGSQALLLSLSSPLAGNWLDACAGAGGKTLQLAGKLLPTGGTVTAYDVRRSALRELGNRQKRAKLSNITIDPSPTGHFDGVLVDAPCTGSGTWRRSPHLKWTTTTDGISRAHERQLLILAKFAHRVKIGGLLVYATCSLCREENEKVVESFRQSHPAFRPEPLRHPVSNDTLADGQLTLLPADLDSDAYFLAAFRRT